MHLRGGIIRPVEGNGDCPLSCRTRLQERTRRLPAGSCHIDAGTTINGIRSFEFLLKFKIA
jgi:hypothetical protein